MTQAHGQILHASCVDLNGHGLLILGPSGSGKSALALRLMALGATLVADDQTLVENRDGVLVASCPPPIRGLIEARGIGLLRAPATDSTEVALAIDLGGTEDQRLPPFRTVTIERCGINLVLRPQNDHFPEALLLYLSRGRQA